MTRPRLHAAYQRERLFAVLDGARTVPVVWLAGPPGAGKTTLAATWLEARRKPGIWYQLDPGDGDPATFFYYLRKAAGAAGVARNAPLPLLTAEYQSDVIAFARRWFRELFSRLPDGAVLALDNYQEVEAGSVFHRVLAAAVEDIPESVQLVVMSRLDPPRELARVLAHERLTLIGDEALRLTREEAAGIAAGKDALTADQVRALHAESGGWAAGFTLLRERTRRTGWVNRVDERATMQEVFDYFMEQVFREVPPDGRDALVATAVLPRFTEAMAVELTATPHIADLVEALYRRHLFVERRYGNEITYEYHALFRAFLLDQARRSQTTAAFADLSRRAAALLERSGWAEDALQLFLDAGDRSGAAGLLEKLAPALVEAGRGATYRDTLARLPAPDVDARPLLSYWLGTSLMGVNSPGARAAYERARIAFARGRDCTGQAMAVAGLLSTFLTNRDDDLSLVQQWLAMIEPLFRDEPRFPSSALAARVYGTLLGTMDWIAPAHPLLPACLQRLETLLTEPLDDDIKVTVAGHLIEHYASAGFIHRAEDLIAATAPLVARTSVSLLGRSYWLIRTWSALWAAGDLERARANLERAIDLSVQNHRGPGGFIAGLRLAELLLDSGDPEAVPPLLERLPTLMPAYIVRSASQNRRTAWTEFIQGKYLALTGNPDQAAGHFEQAWSTISEGMVWARVTFGPEWLSILLDRGEVDRARTVLEACREVFPARLYPLQAFRWQAMDALVRASSGDTQAIPALVEALRRLRDLGVIVPFASQPVAARHVAELLLRNGVELPYARAWVRRMNLRPSSPSVPNWPWPVRIRTLGRFEVMVDDVPLRFTGKRPRRPLELLQAIVAFGAKEIRTETLCNALWPDSDGDASEAALSVTVSRLRKLLKHDTAVVLENGTVSLDDRTCWVDVSSFNVECHHVETTRGAAGAERLLDAYRGGFLENEREQSWMLPIRKELRRRFAMGIATVKGALEREGRVQEAAALQRDALQRAPGSE